MRSWWPATWNASRTTLPTFPRTSSFGFWEPMCVITRNQPLLLHVAWNDASSRREDKIPKNNIKVPPVNPCVLCSKDFFLNHRGPGVSQGRSSLAHTTPCVTLFEPHEPENPRFCHLRHRRRPQYSSPQRIRRGSLSPARGSAEELDYRKGEVRRGWLDHHAARFDRRRGFRWRSRHAQSGRAVRRGI